MVNNAAILERRDFAAYCIARSGLDTLTRCTAQVLAPHVQVNGAAPGAILPVDGGASLSGG